MLYYSMWQWEIFCGLFCNVLLFWQSTVVEKCVLLSLNDYDY